MRKSRAEAPAARLDGSRTAENLRRALAAEAALHFRYLSCATLADFEGREEGAALLRELAEGGATTVQGCADLLRRAADPETGLSLGSTPRNVEWLLQSESRLSGRDYPAMAAAARREGFPDVAAWFDTLAKLKRSRARRLRRLARG